MTRAPLLLALCCGCYFRPEFDAHRDAPTADDAELDGLPDMVDAPDTPNIAFVTSAVVTVDTLGSVAAADAFCDAAAAAAGLEDNTYLAWISTDAETAPNKLIAARGWKRVDGKPFANTIPDLLNGLIYYPLRIDETGNDIGPVKVATATKPGGTTATNDCTGFVGGAGETILYGWSDATRDRWTDSNQQVTCDAPVHLYCFGSKKAADISAPDKNTPGRRAFVSHGTWLPGSGNTDADLVCSDAATAAMLPGTFIALLETSISSAIARFPLTGPNWVRLDGVPLAASPDAFAQGQLDVPLNLDNSGDYTTALVWTGIGQIPNTTSGQTCFSWTSTGTMGEVGASSRSSSEWMHGSSALDCGDAYRVYCLEQ